MTIPHEPAFPAEEYAARLAAVRSGMADRDLDALLVFAPHNVFYLSGMDSENLFDFQCLVVPATGEPILVILDFEEARAANSVGAGRVVSYHAFDDPNSPVHVRTDVPNGNGGRGVHLGTDPAARAGGTGRPRPRRRTGGGTNCAPPRSRAGPARAATAWTG